VDLVKVMDSMLAVSFEPAQPANGLLDADKLDADYFILLCNFCSFLSYFMPLSLFLFFFLIKSVV